VQDTNGTDDAADRWREQFTRADGLAAAAPEQERRRRGRQFEQILHGMLAEAGLEPRIRFRPVGEEIDGSFFHRGRVLLLEAKWTRDPLPASSIYQFRGKVEGKVVGTIGVFISMGGFSPDSVDALIAGKVINTILFDGDDMRAIAAGQVSFSAALDRKLRAAAENGTPHLPLRDPVSRQPLDLTPQADRPGLAAMVLVEGPFDALLVHAIADVLGPPAGQLQVIPAGGAFNLAALANAMHNAASDTPVIIIADGDGQPGAVRRRIETGLEALNPGSSGQTQILVLDPTFEEAVGILEGFAVGRRRVLELDRGLLRDKVRAANIRRLAQDNPQIQLLLHALSLDT
jgi:hypothetical protein